MSAFTFPINYHPLGLSWPVIGIGLAVIVVAAFLAVGLQGWRERRLAARRHTDPDCVFCRIVAGASPALIVRKWRDAVAFYPKADERGDRGCTPGHILVVPRVHVVDFTRDDHVSAVTAARASQLARDLGGQWNEITSAGVDATQTVFHLHRHLVPRRRGDGLALPWTGQVGEVLSHG